MKLNEVTEKTYVFSIPIKTLIILTVTFFLNWLIARKIFRFCKHRNFIWNRVIERCYDRTFAVTNTLDRFNVYWQRLGWKIWDPIKNERKTMQRHNSQEDKSPQLVVSHEDDITWFTIVSSMLYASLRVRGLLRRACVFSFNFFWVLHEELRGMI